MAQIFAAQASVAPTNTALPNGAATVVLTLVGLTPPLGNFKAVIDGTLYVTVAADNAALGIQVIRNPDAEAVQVVALELDLPAAAAITVAVPIFGTDSVPDGRECIYQALVTVAGGAGDGLAQAGSGMRATAISG